MFDNFLLECWRGLIVLAPSLFLGTVIAGLLHVLLPSTFIGRQLSGRWGVFKAVAFGVPMPLCSCGVLPAAFGLRRDGASRGAAVGFLISTPQTGVDSILVSASFLGWPFALFKVVSAAVTGIAGGLLTDRLVKDADEPADLGGHRAEERGWRGALSHGLELLRSIWRWLIFGIAVSALLTTLLPPNALAGLGAGGGLIAMLVALAIGLPLYVCAVASVPIAAALVAAGLPTGAALVFLMAGPATNAADVGAIYKALGARVLAIYLGVLVVGSMLGGLLFESLISPEAIAKVQAHDHGPASWQVGAAVLLLLLLSFFAFDDLRRWLARRRAVPAQDLLSLPVVGMTCEGCVRHLENKVKAEPGVDGVVVSLNPGRVEARGRIDEARLREVVREAGYQVG